MTIDTRPPSMVLLFFVALLGVEHFDKLNDSRGCGLIVCLAVMLAGMIFFCDSKK